MAFSGVRRSGTPCALGQQSPARIYFMTDLVRQVNLKRMPVNRKLIIWVFVVTGVMSGWLWWREQKPKLPALKISYLIENKEMAGERDASRETARLLTQIRTKLSAVQGNWAVAVYRIDEKKGYGTGEAMVLPAASIMKVPILLAVMKKVENGQLKMDSEYVLREEDKQSGSGPIEFMDAGTALSVRRLVEEMMKKSDNTAPVVLIRLVGRKEIEKEIEVLGMKNTNFGENTTTAYDAGLMWRKIYEMKDEEMWTLLKDSIYEERIPAGVPREVEVLHKVGTDVNVWADAGIIQCSVLSAQCSTKPFILVILNEGVDMDEAKKLVPDLSRTIWEYEAN